MRQLCFLVLLLVSFLVSDDGIRTVDAGFLDSLNIQSNFMEKMTPLMDKLPRLLPLLNGKVKSQKCRKQGKAISEKAAEIAKKKSKETKDNEEGDSKGSEEETKDSLKVFCEMERECFFEYVDAMKPLLETNMLKSMLKGMDVSLINSYAGPLFDWACAKPGARDEL